MARDAISGEDIHGMAPHMHMACKEEQEDFELTLAEVHWDRRCQGPPPRKPPTAEPPEP